MVFYKDNQWNISKMKVTYEDNGELNEKNVGLEGKEWWTNLEKLWDDIKIIRFDELEIREKQIIRLGNVNAANIPDGFGTIVSDYVKTGRFPNDFTHRLKDIEVEEISRRQGIDLSEREIEALQLALQVSDLELKILELGGGI